jgi:hypothetical protein
MQRVSLRKVDMDMPIEAYLTAAHRRQVDAVARHANWAANRMASWALTQWRSHTRGFRLNPTELKSWLMEIRFRLCNPVFVRQDLRIYGVNPILLELTADIAIRRIEAAIAEDEGRR